MSITETVGFQGLGGNITAGGTLTVNSVDVTVKRHGVLVGLSYRCLTGTDSVDTDCIDTVVFNGSESLTRVPGSRVYNYGSSTEQIIDEWWYLASPTSSVGNVVITTKTNSIRLLADVIVIDGLNLASPHDAVVPNSGRGTTPTNSISSAVNDVVYSLLSHRNTNSALTPDGDTVVHSSQQSGSGSAQVFHGIYKTTGAATVTPSGSLSVLANWIVNSLNFNISATPAPVADFTATPLSGAAPLGITVTDASTNTPTTWNYSWGDGSPDSTTQNPTHTYTVPGTYTIVQTVTNAGGSDTKTRTGYVTVTSSGTAFFRRAKSGGIQNLNGGMQ